MSSITKISLLIDKLSIEKNETLEKELIDLMKKEIEEMNEKTFDFDIIFSWYNSFLKDYIFTHYIDDPLMTIIYKKAIEYKIDASEFIDYTVDIQLKQHELIENKLTDDCLKYRNKKDITNDEFIDYIKKLNELNEPTKEDYFIAFNLIIDKKYVLDDDIYRKFFKKFCLFELGEFSLKNVKLYIDDIETVGKTGKVIVKNGDIEEIVIAIYLNRSSLKIENVLLNLRTLFHELKHVFQNFETDELYRIDIINRLEDMLLMGYVYKADGDSKNYYYDLNYDKVNVEVDANYCSFILLLNFLELVAPITYKEKYDEINKKIDTYYKMSTDTERFYPCEDTNNLHVLFAQKLEKYPEMLLGDYLSSGQKAVLYQIYDTNFKPKTLDKYYDKKTEILEKLSVLPVSEEKTLSELSEQLHFYDSVISNLEYSRENMIRNLYSLKEYKSTIASINIEVQEKITSIERNLKLMDLIMGYGEQNGRSKK